MNKLNDLRITTGSGEDMVLMTLDDGFEILFALFASQRSINRKY